jgi:predicted type IV restriction endonuclease
MDDKPFLVLDLSAVDPTLLPELAKLTKESFDLDSVINAAGELKYIGQIKRALAAEFKNPSAEWVKLFTSRVYGKNVTARVREQFESLGSKAASQFLNEQVNDRLKAALGDDVPPVTVGASQPAAEQRIPAVVAVVQSDQPACDDEKSARLLVTTDEEIEGF